AEVVFIRLDVTRAAIASLRRRCPADKRIEHLTHAKVVDRRTEEYRRLLACKKSGRIELAGGARNKLDIRGELLAFNRELFFQARIIQAFDHFAALTSLGLVRRKPKQLVVGQVVYAPEAFGHAHGPGDRRAFNIQYR